MIKTKKYLLLAVLCAAPLLCFGQEQISAHISNVRFQQSDDVVLIQYNLNLYDAKKVQNVKAYISLDGGQSYKPLTNVSGDVGTITQSGEKQIVFDIFKEFGNDAITGDIKFKVEGESKATSPYFKPVDHIITFGFAWGMTPQTGRISLGYCNKWGAYFSYKLTYNGSFVDTGVDLSNVDFNEKAYYRKAYNAGVMYHLFNYYPNGGGYIYLYGGLGYGEYGAAYLTENERTYFRPLVHKGLEAEFGIVIALGFTVSCGYSILFASDSQKFGDLFLGIGLTIPLKASRYNSSKN